MFGENQAFWEVDYPHPPKNDFLPFSVQNEAIAAAVYVHERLG